MGRGVANKAGSNVFVGRLVTVSEIEVDEAGTAVGFD